MQVDTQISGIMRAETETLGTTRCIVVSKIYPSTVFFVFMQTWNTVKILWSFQPLQRGFCNYHGCMTVISVIGGKKIQGMLQPQLLTNKYWEGNIYH